MLREGQVVRRSEVEESLIRLNPACCSLLLGPPCRPIFWILVPPAAERQQPATNLGAEKATTRLWPLHVSGHCCAQQTGMHIGCGSTAYSVGTVYGGKGDLYASKFWGNRNNRVSVDHSTSKLVPHPQLLFALGLPTILNWLPINSGNQQCCLLTAPTKPSPLRPQHSLSQPRLPLQIRCLLHGQLWTVLRATSGIGSHGNLQR